MDLPHWLSADLRLAFEPTATAVEAALAGYAYVGLVDGALDGAPSGAVERLLGRALFTHHLARLRDVRGAAEPLFDACWQAFAEGCAQRQRALRIGAQHTRGDFEASVRRARPMVLPSAALLRLAGRSERVPAIEALVGHSTRAAQLFDDMVDAERDLAAGRFTGVVRRLGGGEGAAVLRRRLYLEGGADDIISDVIANLDAARTVACRNGWAAIDAGFAGEQSRVRAAQRALATERAEVIFGACHAMGREIA